MRARIIRIRRVDLDDRSIDDERKAQEQTSKDLQRPPPKRVNSQDTDGSTDERNYRIYSLEQQRSTGRNADLREDLRAEILDR
jgi:hypothetical protein